jgi:hypothetical protein
MYVSISQELTRQHREEIMQGVRAAREAVAARSNHKGTSRLVRDLGWEFVRYAGLLILASASAISPRR